MVEIQNAYHVIDAVLIHGDTGKRRGFNYIDRFGHILVNIQSDDIDACSHDLGGHDIRKIYRGLNKLRAFLVKDVLVLGGLDNGG